MAAERDQLKAMLTSLVDDGPGNTAQLAMRLNFGMATASSTAVDLVRRGFAERPEEGSFSATSAGREFLRAGGKFATQPKRKGEARRSKIVQGTLRQRAWRAMRLHRRFTIPDLLTVAGTERDRTAQNNLQRYLRALCAGGYVVKLPRPVPGTVPTSPGFALFQLLRDPGEIAPVVKRDGTLVDHNTPSEVKS